MVNFDMSTRSKTFENFNQNSYAKRGNDSSLSLTCSSVSTFENLDNTVVCSKTIEGNECLITEGYCPSINDNDEISILADTKDPNDDRELVSNPKSTPYLATGRILTTYLNVKSNEDNKYHTLQFIGTGFMEGPNVMVTAGHCVYSDVTVKEYDDGIDNPVFPNIIEFYPGINGNAELTSSYSFYCKAKTVNIPTGYYYDINANDDWSAVELDRDIGYSTGWNGKISNWYSKTSKVFTYGYPGDKSSTMWYSEGKILKKDNNYRYTTDVYGLGGQSGSAYYMTDSSNNTYVWGILTHNYSYDNWETIAGTSGVYINNFIFHYLNSFVTYHNYEHLAATIKPSDYGFADAYPTTVLTTQHTLNTGFSFSTTRYRTGFIQGEYIVMSPFRKNIDEAYIEYQFDVPVSKKEVELTHWRPLYHEWTYSSNCTAELKTKSGDCFDLLDLGLSVDRTSPGTYTFVFDEPVYCFGFYMNSTMTCVNDNNRGRLCIGNMNVYTTEGWY